MNLVLSGDEIALLAQLVETRLHELGPELRRTEQMQMHDALKSQKLALEKILRRLHEAE